MGEMSLSKRMYYKIDVEAEHPTVHPSIDIRTVKEWADDVAALETENERLRNAVTLALKCLGEPRIGDDTNRVGAIFALREALGTG